MKILFINQFYCPDPAATGQLMADQAEEFSRRGHEVHVLCSLRSYSGGNDRYLQCETFNGVRIHRVGATGFGRGSLLGRLVDYLSFYVMAFIRAFLMPRMDVCVCLATPPFIGIVGMLLHLLKGTKFVFWVMDIYPQIAVTFGIIKRNSLLDRSLSLLSKVLYRQASLIISLGEVMTKRLIEVGASEEKIITVHNWVPREVIAPKPREESMARASWGLNGHIAVMYSGNLGLGHDLGTFVKAAARLQNDLHMRMLFVGQGKGLAPLENMCKKQGTECVSFYAPQPLENLDDSLAAGDIHLVSQKMGTQGLMVPSKMYGVLAAGRPTVFVGPEDCEPAQILRDSQSGIIVAPGDVDGVVQALRNLADNADRRKEMGKCAREYYEKRFGRNRSIRMSAEAIEELCPEAAHRMSSAKRFGMMGIFATAIIGLFLFMSRMGALTDSFQALLERGLDQAIRTYSKSGTFWSFLIGAFIATTCLTPLVMIMARKTGALDHGGHRKVNRRPIPLLGGIAIAAPFFGACVLGLLGPTDLLHKLNEQHMNLWAVLIGGAGCVAIGIIDDTRGMRVRHKFLLQVGLALFVCLCGFAVESVTLPIVGTIYLGPVWGTALTVLWIVGLTNAMNIIDGLDGLASGIALIATIGLGCIAAFNGAIIATLLCAVLAGSLAAFLMYNFHPARIFLGDTGSLFLGFTLATISLTSSLKTPGTVIFLAPILALGLPIFEVALSMVRRYARGLPVSSADANHIHHCLLRQGLSQRRVALIMYGAALVCMVAALLTITGSEKASAMYLPLSMYALVILTVGWLAGYGQDLGEIFEIRKRNQLYQAFVNYATKSLSAEGSSLTPNALLGIICAEMQLSYLDVSFCDPAESFGSRNVPDGATAAQEPVKEMNVKTPNGERVLIRYQHSGNLGKIEREEIQKHIGRIFENSTIRRYRQSIHVVEARNTVPECKVIPILTNKKADAKITIASVGA